jgi:DNA-binding CsgD family transcriptional regulator
MAKAGSAAFAARVGVRELRLNLNSLTDDGAGDPILCQTRALTMAQEMPGKYGELIVLDPVDQRANPEMVLIDAFINAYADIPPGPERLRICRDLADTAEASDLAPRGLARCLLCWEALRGARLDEAMRWAVASRDDLEFADAAYAGVFVHLHAINICIQLDDWAQAQTHANEAEEIAKLFFPDDPRLLNLIWLNAAWIESEQGVQLRSEDLATCFAATCAGEGWMEALWTATVLASRQALRRGDVLGAARMLERGLGEATARDATRIVWALRCERVRLLTALGDLDAAGADARALELDDLGRDPLDTPCLTWREVTEGWINAAHLCLAQDDVGKAETIARHLAAFSEAHAVPRLAAISRQLLDIIAGGDCTEAGDAIAVHIEDASQEELRDRRVSLLTPREHELMRLVAKGLVNKQIAYELGVTETTIKFHMRKIYKKLRARNRVQALMRMNTGAPA